MSPDYVIQILIALNITGGVAAAWLWWTRRQDAAATRRWTDADLNRQRDQEREERLLHRIEELEDAQALREASMQEEIRQLRVGLEACQKQHAEAQIIAAGLQAENVSMKRQLDALSHSLERRRRDDGPPAGQEERRLS